MLEVWVVVPVLTGMSVAGTLWDEEWVDTSSDAGFFCDLEVASDGTVHAAYQDDGTQDMRHGSRSPGGVWILGTVESANDSGSYASLALESDGTPHVGYFQNFQETIAIPFPPYSIIQDRWKLQHAVDNGSGWTITTARENNDQGEHAAMALDDAGDPLFGYYFFSTTHEARFTSWNGAGWSDELLDNSGIVGAGISVATDASGNPHVAYVNETTGSLIYRTHDGSSWTPLAQAVVDASGVTYGKTCIAVHGGTVHILYNDTTGLRHVSGSPGAWVNGLVDDDPIVPQSLSLALDSSGLPRISYIGDWILRWAVKDGGSWAVENVFPGADGDPQMFTAIAVDTEDRTYIGARFYDSAGGTGGLLLLEGGDADDDDDGMADQWELDNGLDPTDPDDAWENPDGDGWQNLHEYWNGTDPHDEDSDDDGLWDDEEPGIGTDPNDPDSDDDGLPDGWEDDHGLDPTSDIGDDGAAGNSDGDAFTNLQEFGYGISPVHHDGNPADDMDGDGLTNAEEIAQQTHPYQWDTDSDGLGDGDEVNTHSTDPADSDSDDDGLPDGVEVGYHLFWDSFEGASFGDGWTHGGDAIWTIDSTHGDEGTQSARSGGITHGQSSWLEMEVDLLGAGHVSFRYRTSTEEGQDSLLFAIDDGPPASYSGANEWSFADHPLDAGPHTLRWTFQKDASGSAGDDAVWIDGVYVGVQTTSTNANNPDSDADGLSDGDEVNTHGTAPTNDDSDFDGLKDGEEINTHGTDPTNRDSDGDGIRDGDEINTHGTLPNNPDSDGDGMPDGWELTHGLQPLVDDAAGDGDSDGLSNLGEFQNGTSPGVADTDGDNMPDGWEVDHGLDPTTTNPGGSPTGDPDGDQLTNLAEYQNGTDPQDPDSDSDGMPDGWEVSHGLRADDGTGPNGATGDPDSDQLNNIDEYGHGVDPQDNDSDNDTLLDGHEVNIHGTDPDKTDTDSDGMPDPWEVAENTNPVFNDAALDPDADGLTNLEEYGEDTDPHDDDTDNDGMPDGWEVDQSLDPKVDDAAGDGDGDGLSNLGEFQNGTSVSDDDSDNDGMKDGWEAGYGLDPTDDTGNHGAAGDPDSDNLTNLEEQQHGSDPMNADTDGDGMPDGWEVSHSLEPDSSAGEHGAAGDPDLDSLGNLGEYQAGTDPRDDDSDNDGLPDGWEVANALAPDDDSGEHGAAGDPDADSLSNLQEWQEGTDPRDDDTDNDGMPDGWEVNHSLQPLSDDSGADPDSDGLNNLGEYTHDTSPSDDDSDNDGMKDGWEVTHSLQPNVDDSSGDPDNDTLTNLEEYNLGTNPRSDDSDSDGMTDGWENLYGLDPTANDAAGDPDADQLSNLDEFLNGTKPNNSDSDADGMPDGWEVDHGLQPGSNDAALDPDADDLDNLGEYQNGCDPNDDDSDNDGMKDGWEVDHSLDPGSDDSRGDPDSDGANNLVESQHGIDPNNPDSDADTMSDGWEIDNGLDPATNDQGGDPDLDQLTNLAEFQNGTDPQNPDTDGDGMTDGWEVTHSLQPTVDDAAGDADGDGLSNLDEFLNGADPRDSDSDSDGLTDGEEVHTHGTSPANADTDGDGLDDLNEVTSGGHEFVDSGIDLVSSAAQDGALEWGDFDGDGDPDLAIGGIKAGSFSGTSVLRNQGGGSFEVLDSTTGGFLGDLAWGDYDNDGDLDLASVGVLAWSSHLYSSRIEENTATGQPNTIFQPKQDPTGVYEASVEWGDLNNDGHLDCAISGRRQSLETGTRIYIYDPVNGWFVDSGVRLGFGKIDWGDYNADGWDDVVIAGQIYQNVSGTLVSVAAPAGGVSYAGGLDWGDYDGDGDLDLAVSNGSTRIVRNDGAGTFTLLGATLPGSNDDLAWGDYDNDGDLDLAIMNSVAIRVFRNDGGTFVDAGLGLPPCVEGGIDWADYDNDGDLDLAYCGVTSGQKVAKIYDNFVSPRTDPLDYDTDDDGIGDGDEVLVFDTNPALADSDGDGLSDGRELLPELVVTGEGFEPDPPPASGWQPSPGGGGLPAGWSTSGDADWYPTSEHASEGTTSMRSGEIGPNEQTTIEWTGLFPEGSLSFWIKTSCQLGGDGVRFKVDGVPYGTGFAGETGWTKYVAGPLDAGSHTFTWTYEKDGSVDAGSDAAWLDEVRYYIEGTGTDANDPDTDGDQMWDGWEVAYGFNPLVGGEGTGDGDGDGLDNAGEFAHGTNPQKADSDGDGDSDGVEVLETGLDPTDPSSVFRARMQAIGPVEETVEWPSAPGRVYDVWRSTDLTGWTKVAEAVPPSGTGTTSCTVPAEPEGAAFYRIEVRPDP